MKYQEHRIYRYISEPVRFLGLTIDELAIASSSLFGIIYIKDLVWKTLVLISALLGVWLIKKLKKMISGFSLASWIHWHFGVAKSLPPCWPPSHKRYWLA